MYSFENGNIVAVSKKASNFGLSPTLIDIGNKNRHTLTMHRLCPELMLQETLDDIKMREVIPLEFNVEKLYEVFDIKEQDGNASENDLDPTTLYEFDKDDIYLRYN
jgi:hypothetical protein